MASPGFSGLRSYPLRFDDAGLGSVSAKSDAVIPASTQGTSIVLSYGAASGTGAVAKDNGLYRTVFFGFPFLALRSGTDRIDVMRAVLDYCGPKIFPEDVSSQ